jgi:hypothetical protein
MWTTTYYNVDLALFNEFLLPRLGEPPLNVVVLADHRRLTASLERIPVERADTLAAVNQRWLLRGVCPGGQAFHPKTYLAAMGNRVTLLVGSGNLTTGGLDDGREVFTKFASGTAAGDAAIEAWRAWTRRLVALVGDATLAGRLRDLEDRLPARPAVAPAVVPSLLHNLDIPIVEQVAAIITEAGARPIDDLLLAAPFYDDDAEAVGRLLDDLKPRRVRVYVTTSTSVNGGRLAARLACCDAAVEVVA